MEVAVNPLGKGHFQIPSNTLFKTFSRNYFNSEVQIGSRQYVVRHPHHFLHHRIFFKNGPSPASFSFIFGHFQTNINTIFTTNQCEKMSCPSSIRRQDSNPQPLKRESLPITTRPGLPPILHHRIAHFNPCKCPFASHRWMPTFGVL